jgi:5-aminolevulinate synthase
MSVKSSVVLLNCISPSCNFFLFISFEYIQLNSLRRPGPSHIVPVLVGDAALAKAASDKLLAEHNIYVQSINYPTVARGEERLRITVTPRHTLEQMDRLVRAVDKIFTELNINRLADWKRAGGRAGVGLTSGTDEAHVDPLWTDAQLGLLDGTTPRTLRNGDKAVVDYNAVMASREVFDILLGPISGELQPERPIVVGQSSAQRPTPRSMPKMKTGGVPLNKDILVPSSTVSVSA